MPGSSICWNSQFIAPSTFPGTANNAFLQRISGNPIIVSWIRASESKVGSIGAEVADSSGMASSLGCKPFPRYWSKVKLSGTSTGTSMVSMIAIPDIIQDSRTKLSRNPINDLELPGGNNQNIGEGSESVAPIQGSVPSLVKVE